MRSETISPVVAFAPTPINRRPTTPSIFHFKARALIAPRCHRDSRLLIALHRRFHDAFNNVSNVNSTSLTFNLTSSNRLGVASCAFFAICAWLTKRFEHADNEIVCDRSEIGIVDYTWYILVHLYLEVIRMRYARRTTIGSEVSRQFVAGFRSRQTTYQRHAIAIYLTNVAEHFGDALASRDNPSMSKVKDKARPVL